MTGTGESYLDILMSMICVSPPLSPEWFSLALCYYAPAPTSFCFVTQVKIDIFLCLDFLKTGPSTIFSIIRRLDKTLHGVLKGQMH